MPEARRESGSDQPVDPGAMDLRHLPPPEPMRRILDALATLGPGQTLVARTPCRPTPLIERLEAGGYRVAVTMGEAGDAWLRIVFDDGLARA